VTVNLLLGRTASAVGHLLACARSSLQKRLLQPTPP